MTNKITRRNLKNGLFAFIDLLGFSARVESLETEEDLLTLDADVVFVQNQFELKSQDKFTQQSNRIKGKSVLAFSDCVVVSVPQNSGLTEFQGTFDVLMSELDDFALSQGECVLKGIFLRGGVDFGFWYRRKDSLISPALVRAYNLEHDACVPMIAVTPTLRLYLSKHQHRQFYSKDMDPFNNVLKKYSKLPNGKTQWFINYLRLCLEAIHPSLTGEEAEKYRAETPDVQDRLRTEAWQKACSNWAKQHGEAILKAHAEVEGSPVACKYEWLAKYHNAEVKRFFGKEAKSLQIKLN